MTTMARVSTFMEHSFQSGKASNKLVNRFKTREDNVIESDGGVGVGGATLDRGLGNVCLKKVSFALRSE